MESYTTIITAVTRPRSAMPFTNQNVHAVRAFGRPCSWSAATRDHGKQVVALTGGVPGVPVWSPTH